MFDDDDDDEELLLLLSLLLLLDEELLLLLLDRCLSIISLSMQFVHRAAFPEAAIFRCRLENVV